MTPPSYARKIGSALVAAGALAGCGARPEAVETAPPPAAPAAQPPVSATAAAKVRADSARRPYTEADIRFMSDMIAHHAQALVMAGLAPSHGASQSILILSERIINAQQDEIASMQQWLRDRGQAVPEADSSGSTMAMHGEHHGMLMPGMLTPEQLDQLRAARGPAFDRLFLTLMIQHHRGAVTMVQNLFGTTGAAHDETVFKLANDVSVDQTTEIARMETMLARTPS